MDIPATSPINTDVVPAKTYDKWIVERLDFTGDGVNGPLSAEAFFKLGSKDENGHWEFHPTIRRNFFIPDLYVLATNDQEVGQVMQAVTVLLTRLATEAGVL